MHIRGGLKAKDQDAFMSNVSSHVGAFLQPGEDPACKNKPLVLDKDVMVRNYLSLLTPLADLNSNWIVHNISPATVRWCFADDGTITAKIMEYKDVTLLNDILQDPDFKPDCHAFYPAYALLVNQQRTQKVYREKTKFHRAALPLWAAWQKAQKGAVDVDPLELAFTALLLGKQCLQSIAPEVNRVVAALFAKSDPTASTHKAFVTELKNFRKLYDSVFLPAFNTMYPESEQFYLREYEYAAFTFYHHFAVAFNKITQQSLAEQEPEEVFVSELYVNVDLYSVFFAIAGILTAPSQFLDSFQEDYQTSIQRLATTLLQHLVLHPDTIRAHAAQIENEYVAAFAPLTGSLGSLLISPPASPASVQPSPPASPLISSADLDWMALIGNDEAAQAPPEAVTASPEISDFAYSGISSITGKSEPKEEAISFTQMLADIQDSPVPAYFKATPQITPKRVQQQIVNQIQTFDDAFRDSLARQHYNVLTQKGAVTPQEQEVMNRVGPQLMQLKHVLTSLKEVNVAAPGTNLTALEQSMLNQLAVATNLLAKLDADVAGVIVKRQREETEQEKEARRKEQAARKKQLAAQREAKGAPEKVEIDPHLMLLIDLSRFPVKLAPADKAYFPKTRKKAVDEFEKILAQLQKHLYEYNARLIKALNPKSGPQEKRTSKSGANTQMNYTPSYLEKRIRAALNLWEATDLTQIPAPFRMAYLNTPVFLRPEAAGAGAAEPPLT